MCKIQSDRYPFFGEKEAYFKEYIENKREIKSLGHKLNYRVANKISDMERKITKLESQNEDSMNATKQQNEIERLLRNYGVSWNAWRGETCLNALEKFLDQGKKGIDPRLKRITACAEEVINYLKEREGSK
jgi:hypothetical protein